jgi:hypothetical protein
MAPDSFVFIAHSDVDNPQPTLINLNHIAFAQFVDDGITLHMLGGASLNFVGPAAKELISLLMRHSILTDGSPTTEILKASSAAKK